MRRRQLIDREVAVVGLGEVSLARASSRGRDPAEVVRRVHDAIEAALDVIDVAAESDTEKVVGEAVRTLRARDRVIVATRVGDVPRLDGRADRLYAKFVQERVEASLRATKLDVLPLVQLPLRTAWLASSAWPDIRGALDRMVREGKVIGWAAVGDEPELANETWLAAIAIDFSACTRDMAPVLVAALAPPPPPPAPPMTIDADIAVALVSSSTFDPAMAALLASAPLGANVPLIGAAPGAGAAVGASGLVAPASPGSVAVTTGVSAPAPSPPKRPVILARRPLAGGALAGTIGVGVRLAPNDDRHALDDAQLEAIAIGVAKLAHRVKREPPAARSCEAASVIVETTPRPANVVCTTLAELALRYVIDRGAIALPRIHAKPDLEELVLCAAADPLPKELVARIDELWPDPST